jgi:hypothetical protein
MVVGTFAGLGLVAAAHNRHAKAVLADAEEYVRFTASAPARDRRLAKWAAIGLVVAGAAGLAVSVLPQFEAFRWLFQLLVPFGAALYGTTTDREVVVADAGLVVSNPVHRQVRPWSAYESYDVTDDAVVVRRAGWSMWGLRDLRRDPKDADDPDAVAAALGTVLPRRRR